MHDALSVARQAGQRILSIYESQYEVHEKSDNTPVTTADIESSRLIESGLQALNPAFPVLSEESDAQPYIERQSWECYWLVDPLDGTREFIKRSGEFTVNIALIQDGLPIVGVIYAPVMDVAYYACAGGSAWKVTADSEPEPMRARRMNGSVTVARSHALKAGPALTAYLEHLGDHEEIRMGSSLKSCLVAEGSADVYIGLGPTSEWDTAAAQCIVEEAGGRITDTKMQALRYNTKESLLNPHFFVFGDKEHNWSLYLRK